MFKSLLPNAKWRKPAEIPLSASKVIPEINKESLDRTEIILVSAFPKSGSTYLTRLLSEVTGYPRGHFVQFYGHNEQDLCEFRLMNSLGGKHVIHQHVKGTNNNILLMKKYNIKPVVLVRNIFDVLYSLRDHIKNEDHKTPICYVHKQYISMDENEKLSYLARFCIPWYLNFYVSWLEASEEIATFWLTYEELFSPRKDKLVSEILGFNGLQFDLDLIQNSVMKMKSENKNIRLNVGRSGRGGQLPSADREAIFDMARAWSLPSGTFDRIGIDL